MNEKLALARKHLDTFAVLYILGFFAVAIIAVICAVIGATADSPLVRTIFYYVAGSFGGVMALAVIAYEVLLVTDPTRKKKPKVKAPPPEPEVQAPAPPPLPEPKTPQSRLVHQHFPGAKKTVPTAKVMKRPATPEKPSRPASPPKTSKA